MKNNFFLGWSSAVAKLNIFLTNLAYFHKTPLEAEVVLKKKEIQTGLSKNRISLLICIMKAMK